MLTKERIKTLAHEVGFDACGVTLPEAPLEAERALAEWIGEGKHGGMRYLEDRGRLRGTAKSVIVLGVNYYSKGAPGVLGGLKGRVARYAWGKDYHRVVRDRIEILKQRIQDEAGAPVYFESSVDTKPMLERAFAERAGLGFRGKQTQLLSFQFGPWLFLAELLTDLRLEPDEPFSASCGTCRLCIDECPTGAIEETGRIDARKCVAYLTIEHKTGIPEALRPQIGNWVFGCDECLNVCPFTAKQTETTWRELAPENGFGPELDLLELIEPRSKSAHRKKFKASAISRANRKQLARNACVVLGNLGRAEALPALWRALEDPSEMVREHARWAIDKIRRKEKSKIASSLCSSQ